jgi:hypothetical protein
VCAVVMIMVWRHINQQNNDERVSKKNHDERFKNKSTSIEKKMFGK